MNDRKRANYESALPEGYEEVYIIDAGNKKTGLLMNAAAVVIAAVIIFISVKLIKPENFFDNYSLARNLLLPAALVIMVFLHELIHGEAYKCLTGQKLSFGLTVSVAYCGVPDIYVYRRTAIISLLAPFFTFLLTAILVFFLEDKWDKMYLMIFEAVHVGGCAGDLYDTYLYLFRFRDPDTLMRDTGPKQTFYQKN